jgi:hypothetical protein
VATVLNDLAVVQHNNPVAAADRLQTVRHNYGRPACIAKPYLLQQACSIVQW